ncbi:MAG: histidine kinase N-terminal 7TM domain-containing protein, partial [Candidatus Margulisiibacteriota bacterium]
MAGGANLILGLSIFSKSSKNQLNLIFSLLCLSLSIWCTSLGIIAAGFSPLLMILGAKGTVLGGLPVPLFVLLFSIWFPSNRINISRTIVIVLSIPSIILFPLIFNKLLIDPAVVNHSLVVNLGPLNYFYILHFVVYFLAAGVILFTKYNRSSKIEKLRYKYFFIGILAASLVGIIFNLILPLFKIYSFVYFGPLGTIFLVAFTAYSILKHRLM